MNRVLHVEVDPTIREMTRMTLERDGFVVETAGDGQAGLDAFDRGIPEVVLLDVMLPGMDGVTVCRRIRDRSVVPIVMLSARTDPIDVVLGLEAGADDYVTKPYGIGEVRARISALLRRAGGQAGSPSGVLRNGSIELDPIRRAATVSGHALDLTPREYELLKQMLSAPGRVLTRGRLLRAVWGTAYSDEGHYLHVYVSRLRRKLAAADPGGNARDLVVAEPGVGYRVREGAD